MTLDRRLTPARPDLAARHLQGQVEAARFVDGVIYEVADAQSPLRNAPAPDAPLDTEALKGERVIVYETTDEGWCWGQLQADGYVGWLGANALRPALAEPTHKVIALRTLVFPARSIKASPVESLPFGARLVVARIDDEFAVTDANLFIPARHLGALDIFDDDFVAVAERFVGTPYLWGGKTSLGIDCSGLTQVALTAAGLPCPRDSDMQERALGVLVTPDRRLGDLVRGDLLFWKGHVAIARGDGTLIHANAFHMATAIEPVDEAVARIAAAGSELLAVKRLTR